MEDGKINVSLHIEGVRGPKELLIFLIFCDRNRYDRQEQS